MDIQMTDFENTCLIVTLGLITNVINHFNVDFIMPVSMADANMERAHFRDAILDTKFWFKTSCVKDLNTYHESELQKSDFLISNKEGDQNDSQPAKYEELYIHEILGGKKESNFPGLWTMIRKFMEVKGYSSDHQEQIE